MSMQFEIEVEPREELGKCASRRLRHADKIPAVIYGAEDEPQSVVVDHTALMRNLEHEAFYSHILTIKLGKKKIKAVLKDLQRHPSKPRLLHADFLRVSEKEKIRMHVPLHFINEEKSPAVKVSKGIVTHMATNVEVSCLAKDLPEYIEVDLSQLEEGQTVHLSEINLPQGVELTALLAGSDQPLASVHIPRSAGEEEAAPAAAAEAPSSGEE